MLNIWKAFVHIEGLLPFCEKLMKPSSSGGQAVMLGLQYHTHDERHCSVSSNCPRVPTLPLFEVNHFFTQ